MQPHRNRIRRRTSQRQPIANTTLRKHILNIIEPLQQPNKHIARLGQRKLLPDADARPAVERDIVPADFPVQPALGPEFLGVGAPDVLAAVEEVHVIPDWLALADVDGLGAVRAAAARDGGVADGGAAVEWDDGVETEDFVEAVLEGLARFEAGEGDGFRVFVGAEVVEDGAAELVEGGGVAGEEEDGPTEEGCGGIAAGQEDVEELGTQFDGVLCCVGEGVEEDVGA